MFETCGRALYRWRWLVLGTMVALTAAAGLWGSGVSARLSDGDNVTPPASQPARASMSPTWPIRSSARTRPTAD